MVVVLGPIVSYIPWPATGANRDSPSFPASARSPGAGSSPAAVAGRARVHGCRPRLDARAENLSTASRRTQQFDPLEGRAAVPRGRQLPGRQSFRVSGSYRLGKSDSAFDLPMNAPEQSPAMLTVAASQPRGAFTYRDPLRSRNLPRPATHIVPHDRHRSRRAIHALALAWLSRSTLPG